MTAAEIRTKVDSQLAALWPKIQQRQSTYASNRNGRYCQIIRTHSAPPADGGDSPCDKLTERPHDQPESPAAFMSVDTPAALAFLLTIDVYDGPLGCGYVASAMVSISGATWKRAAQVGPETYRAHGWQRVA